MTLDIAEALFVIDQLPGEDLPSLAINLLQAGVDTAAVRQLASMHRPTLRDSASTFRKIVAELGHVFPSKETAIEIISRDLARSVIQGTVTPRLAASRGAQFAAAADYPKALMPFYMAEEEFGLHDYGTFSRGIHEIEARLIAYCRELTNDDHQRAV